MGGTSLFPLNGVRKGKKLVQTAGKWLAKKHHRFGSKRKKMLFNFTRKAFLTNVTNSNFLV